jgi:hypothetical protein
LDRLMHAPNRLELRSDPLPNNPGKPKAPEHEDS